MTADDCKQLAQTRAALEDAIDWIEATALVRIKDGSSGRMLAELIWHDGALCKVRKLDEVVESTGG